MKKHLPLLAFIMLFSASAAQASDNTCLEKAQNQAQLTECAAVALKAADNDLNALYRRMQDRVKDDSSTKTLLIDAQRKWLSFRDAECNFTAVRSAGGSIHAMDVNSCLADLTRSRVRELQIHLDCSKGAGEQEAMQCALPRAGR